MKSLILLASLFFSASAFASQNQYYIDVKLGINSQQVAHAVMMALEGEPATVSSFTKSDETFISITPVKGEYNGQETIELSIIVGKVFTDGTEMIVSKPKLVMESGKQGSITISEIDGDEIHIEITATKL